MLHYETIFPLKKSVEQGSMQTCSNRELVYSFWEGATKLNVFLQSNRVVNSLSALTRSLTHPARMGPMSLCRDVASVARPASIRHPFVVRPQFQNASSSPLLTRF